MIDTLLAHREAARALEAPRKYGLNGRFGLLTLHRPSNVDDACGLEELLGAVAVVAREVPLVFPVHPRTRKAIDASPVARALVGEQRLHLLDPLGYLEFVGLMERAAVVLTDSGGVQEETTILGVPCLTLRESTERPVTVSNGTNIVAGTNPAGIVAAWESMKDRPPCSGRRPLWDGHAAERIVSVLDAIL